MYKILNGVGHLHKFGVLHRDLSTNCIFCDKNYEVKIFGFEKSKQFQYQFEISSLKPSTFGKLNDFNYLSPEVLYSNFDKKLVGFSKKSDVWSIGCIFAELLLGKPVFECDSR
jgi:serine/threonine protein kinase